jgi:hypothetical protein
MKVAAVAVAAITHAEMERLDRMLRERKSLRMFGKQKAAPSREPPFARNE